MAKRKDRKFNGRRTIQWPKGQTKMAKRRTDNTMAKRRTDNTMAKRRTDNTMAKRRDR